MQPCDVGSPNCKQETADHQVCGSCMRNICEGCAEYLTTVSDDYGNHYMVPEALANEDSFGRVGVCPACAHLETFKTTAETNYDLAIQHLLSHHPDAKLEEVVNHGALDDYHDALHYGDDNEKTAGIMPYPYDHPRNNLRVAAVGAQLTKEELQELIDVHQKKLTDPNISPEDEKMHRNSLAALGVSASTGPATPTPVPTQPAPVVAPTSYNPYNPLAPPAAPFHQEIRYPHGLRPDEPIEIANHLKLLQPQGPDGVVAPNAVLPHLRSIDPRRMPGSAASLGVVSPDHPYAHFPGPSKFFNKKTFDRYNSGNLSSEETFSLTNGYPVDVNKIQSKNRDAAIKDVGGIDKNGDILGIKTSGHADCVSKGGNKDAGLTSICNRCGKHKMVGGDFNNNPVSREEDVFPTNVSVFQSPVEIAKGTALIQRLRGQHFEYASYKRNAIMAQRKADPSIGAGRPPDEIKNMAWEGFTPPTSEFSDKDGNSIYKYTLNGEEV